MEGPILRVHFVTPQEKIEEQERARERERQVAIERVRLARIARSFVGPTQFEQKVEELKLTPNEYATSLDLKEWARRNRCERYIPEELLQSYGLEVSDRQWDWSLASWKAYRDQRDGKEPEMEG